MAVVVMAATVRTMVAHCLLGGLRAAQLRQRGTASLRLRHSFGDAFVGQQIHVAADFVIEIPLDILLMQQVAEAVDDAGCKSHCVPLGCLQSMGHGFRDRRPLFRLDAELAFPRLRAPVEFGAPLVL